MQPDSFVCHECKASTLGQRFCPGCGVIQKVATISGVAASTVPPAKGGGAKGGGAKGAAKGAKGGAAGTVPPKQQFSISKEEVQRRFAEAVSLTVDDQAMVFLRAFVVEFAGKFEEVLVLAEQFKKYYSRREQVALDQFEALRFLEARGETRTASDLRATLQFIDASHSSADLNFLEYLLFNYQKHPAALFEDTGNANAELVRKLEEAIANYRRVLREKVEREEKKEELRGRAAGGDLKAKSELKRMELQEGGAAAASAADEAISLQKKLQAKRALANPEDDKKRLLEEETKRLEEEKRRQEAEERRKREESKKKLAEKAKLWK